MTTADYSKKSFFAAANSCDGFISFFDDIFSQKELDFLYIIKGGSGTGKSRLMNEIAQEAQKRKESVEYFYCSSDPMSLDGIILCERKIGVIDGTSPHVCEPRLPGCFDEIINLGAFWDSEKLICHKNEIVRLNFEKKRLYKIAYSYLSVEGELALMSDMLLSRLVKREKLDKWAERFCKRYAPSEHYFEKTRLISGISYLGTTHLDSFYSMADEHFTVSDPVNIASCVFEAIKKSASLRGISMYISYDPLNTKKINGLYFPDHKVSVTLSSAKKQYGNDMIINTERFFSRESYKSIRQSIRLIGKCSDSMRTWATDTMKEISKLHAELEKIYVSAMNFEAKEAFTKTLKERIFTR